MRLHTGALVISVFVVWAVLYSAFGALIALWPQQAGKFCGLLLQADSTAAVKSLTLPHFMSGLIATSAFVALGTWMASNLYNGFLAASEREEAQAPVATAVGK